MYKCNRKQPKQPRNHNDQTNKTMKDTKLRRKRERTREQLIDCGRIELT